DLVETRVRVQLVFLTRLEGVQPDQQALRPEQGALAHPGFVEDRVLLGADRGRGLEVHASPFPALLGSLGAGLGHDPAAGHCPAVAAVACWVPIVSEPGTMPASVPNPYPESEEVRRWPRGGESDSDPGRSARRTCQW